MTSLIYCHLVGEGSVMLRPRKGIPVSASAGRVIQRRYKSRCVVLGAGWAGFRLAKDLDKSQYDVTVISPRNHFLFTPLLPSTSVGTLEFRCVQEPVRTIKGKYFSYYFLRNDHGVSLQDFITYHIEAVFFSSHSYMTSLLYKQHNYRKTAHHKFFLLTHRV